MKKTENEEERERRRKRMKRKRIKRKRMKRSPIPRSFNNKGTVEGNALLIRTAHQTEAERASCLAASVLTNALALLTISDNGDLTTYKEAMESALRDQWIEATKDELLKYYCVRTLRHDFVTHTKQCASTVRFTVLFLTHLHHGLTVIFLTKAHHVRARDE
jgi:hypothetical protein